MNSKQKQAKQEPATAESVPAEFVIPCNGHTFVVNLNRETVDEHRRRGAPDMIGVKCPTCALSYDLHGGTLQTAIEDAQREHVKRLGQPAGAVTVHVKGEHRKTSEAKIHQGHALPGNAHEKKRPPRIEREFEDGDVLESLAGNKVIHKKSGQGGGGGGGGQGGGGNPHG